MAQEPYTGVPTVQPAAAPPEDYLRVQANPEEFGGFIAQGEQKAGQGLEQTAGNLFNIEEFRGKINVDDQVNQWMTARDRILRGNPGQPAIGPDGNPVLGPDGKPQPDLGFMGLEGRAAADQREATLKALEDARKAGRANLTMPIDQLAYDEQTRRLYSYAAQDIGAKADSGFKTWAGGVNTDAANHAMTDYLSSGFDPNHASDYIHFKVQEAQVKFGDDPTINQAVAEQARRDLLKAQIEQISVAEPQKARALADDPKSKAILGKEYEPVSLRLQERADKQQGQAVGDVEYKKAGAQNFEFPNAVSPDQLHSAIWGQESGNRSNVGVSPTGARGPGQIEPDTWAQWARPGENINNPTDNRAVSARILDSYYQQYGGDAARVAVAYYSGPQNVAPAGSPTPWIRDKSPPSGISGPSTSQYVGDIVQRLGGTKADAARAIMVDHPELNDRAQQYAMERVRQLAYDATVASNLNAAAKKEANDQAANGFVTEILKGQIPTQQQIADDPNMNWETKRTLGEVALKKSGSDLQAAQEAYGPGFWGAYKGVSAPAGDPNRIADFQQLLQRAGLPDEDPTHITLAGVEKLGQVMNQNQKSVGDAAVNTAKVGLLNYAKQKLSFEEDTGPIKIRDPKGEALFNGKFIPQFEAAYDQWVKAGKDPWQFLSQDNVDKMLTGMRSKSEMAADRMTAIGAATGEQTTPLPPAPQGVNENSWNAILLAPPVAKGGGQYPAAAWFSAIDILQKNPTPEVIKAFDAKFGAAGLSGQEILDKFGGKP